MFARWSVQQRVNVTDEEGWWRSGLISGAIRAVGLMGVNGLPDNPDILEINLRPLPRPLKWGMSVLCADEQTMLKIL